MPIEPTNPAYSGTASDHDSGSVELEVTALAAGGRGVARAGGQVWFVRGAVPGDRILASPERSGRRFTEGRIVEILQESGARRPPACAVQSRCGGCPWMVLEEPEQRVWKGQVVRDALRRIGRLGGLEVEEVRASPRELGYRNKVELTLGRDAAGRPAIGYHAASGRETGGCLVDVERCEVQHETANAVLASARQFLSERTDEWADGVAGSDPFRLILRRSEWTGEVLVALRETGKPFPNAAELAARLREDHPSVVGVVRLRSAVGRRGGSRNVPVSGRSWIEERLGGISFRLPASCFLQVNTEMASVMLEVLAEHCGEVSGTRIHDLYGGVGVQGLTLASLGGDVKICEADGEAVRCGRRTAQHHGRKRVEFVQADVRRFLGVELEARRNADLIVANPPRTGLGRGVVDGICKLAPSKVVLVSCDPATLARDARGFVERGFRPVRVTPLDMFPQTAHVETVFSLSR